MRSFSWEYFSLTGDVDAYLLYKDMVILDSEHETDDEIVNMEEELSTGYYS